jgi:hypothetical protein
MEVETSAAVVESFDATITAIQESWPAKIKVRKSSGANVSITVNDTTVITRKGAPLDFNALKGGQSVRITPSRQDSAIAARIEILEG